MTQAVVSASNAPVGISQPHGGSEIERSDTEKEADTQVRGPGWG